MRVQWTSADHHVSVDHFFTPFKDLKLRDGSVEIVEVTEEANVLCVTLRCSLFLALFVEVEAPRDVYGFWDDNTFHMVANEIKQLRFTYRNTSGTTRLLEKELIVRWLQQTPQSDSSQITMDRVAVE